MMNNKEVLSEWVFKGDSTTIFQKCRKKTSELTPQQRKRQRKLKAAGDRRCQARKCK